MNARDAMSLQPSSLVLESVRMTNDAAFADKRTPSVTVLLHSAVPDALINSNQVGGRETDIHDHPCQRPRLKQAPRTSAYRAWTAHTPATWLVREREVNRNNIKVDIYDRILTRSTRETLT